MSGFIPVLSILFHWSVFLFLSQKSLFHLVLYPAWYFTPWCCERLKAGGKGDDRGWDGWMASLTQWTWVWVISGSWWWTGKPGVLQSMGSQRIGHDRATELNWTEAQWQYTAWHTPFPVWNQSVVPCLVLTVASCPAHRFLRRQVRWSAIPISVSHS